jgi:hypothetical protein
VTSKKYSSLSYAALLRIIQDAGGFPADQAPSELRGHLLTALSDFESLRTLRPAATAQISRLKKIHKCASDLAKLLSADEEDQGLINKFWRKQVSKDALSPEAAIQLQRLIEQSGWLKESPRSIVAKVLAHNAVSGSAFEWLVGRMLPPIFEWFFREEITLYKEGWYLRFASRVLKEFAITNHGKPYSRQSILKALTDARRRRSRRRPIVGKNDK